MKLQFKNIIDKYKGKKCLVIGHGPSLNKYLAKLELLKNDGYILIGCNNWNEFYLNCPPHYWVNANSADTSKTFFDVINKYKPVWVYADSIDLTDQSWLEKSLTSDFLPYDQRHFNGKKCSECNRFGCGKYLNPERLTIQEELQRYTNYTEHYQSGCTVVLHSIALAVIMGFSEINLIGLDFNYRLGYAVNCTGRKPPDSGDYFDDHKWGKYIFSDLKIIIESSKKVSTNIYNLNKESSWNLCEFKEI